MSFNKQSSRKTSIKKVLATPKSFSSRKLCAPCLLGSFLFGTALGLGMRLENLSEIEASWLFFSNRSTYACLNASGWPTKLFNNINPATVIFTDLLNFAKNAPNFGS